MGGQLKARTGSQRLRSDCGFGFTTIAAALSSHRLRKRKPRHLLAVDTELPRHRCRQGGLDASRRCPRVRQGRATFVWVSPSRLGDASTQGGLARVRGADAAPGFPAPAPSPGSRRGRLKPPTSTARTRRARKSQPDGHCPGAGWKAGDRALAGAAVGRNPALPGLHRRAGRGSPCPPRDPPLPRPRGPLLRRATANGPQRGNISYWRCVGEVLTDS